MLADKNTKSGHKYLGDVVESRRRPIGEEEALQLTSRRPPHSEKNIHKDVSTTPGDLDILVACCEALPRLLTCLFA